jgi:large subunit ribosomal protein L22
MPGPKTNEREGTRAVLRWAGTSPYKVREVIDIIRDKPVHEAADLLRFVERDAAILVGKVLQSAVANATNNDGQDAEELYVSACYVDEGPTAKRWRPRARGRAARIRKRSSHITVIVSRMPESKLARLQARRHAENLAMRANRVAATRRARVESGEATEGTSRRQRRHPETAVAAEQAAPTGAPAGTEQAGTPEPEIGNELAEGEGAPEAVAPEAGTADAGEEEKGN